MTNNRDIPCLEWQELLAVLRLDELSSSDKRALDQHLSSCSSCQHIRDQYRILHIAVRDLSSSSPPSSLPPRLLQQWEQEATLASPRILKQEDKQFSLSLRKHFSFAIPLARKRFVLAILFVSIIVASFLVYFSPLGKESISSNNEQSIPFSWPTPVTFASSISYEQALQIVTNLGLQPSLDCGLAVLTPNIGEPHPQWKAQGQKETFLHSHQLLVASTPFSVVDWRLRLRALSGVQLGPAQGRRCTALVYGTPPGIAIPLTVAQAGTYAQITFSHPIRTYDAALYTISNVGLTLADYCYEQAEYQGQSPHWHPMGQENIFTKTHTLIVVTTQRVTSSLWLKQLQNTPGVIYVKSSYTTTCS